MRLTVPAAVWKATTICLLIFVAAGAAQAQRRDLRDEPRPTIYRSSDGIWLLDLPPAMEDALDRYNRDFEPWALNDYRGITDYEPSPRQLPWAVIGDFNGDGRPDLAVAGRTDRDAVVVFVLSTGRSKYRASEAEREPYDPEDRGSIRVPVLAYMYPGRYVVADPRLVRPRQLIVEQPGVQVSGGRRQGAVVYVVENNAVVPYYLSDRTAPPAPPTPVRPTVRPLSPAAKPQL
jgi:FG-GAP repeat protein